MKTMKRIVALLCAVTMALALTACNKNAGDTGTNGTDIETLLTKAQTKVDELKNMKADMVMEMDMDLIAEGETMKMTTTMDMAMAMFTDPVKAQMDMSMTMGMGEITDGDQTMAVKMYMIQKEDGSFVIYTNTDGQWDQEVMDATAATKYNPASSMSLYLDSAQSFKSKGEDTIRGMKTTKLEGVISNEALNEVMNASGMEDSLASLGLGSDMADIYKDMGDLPIILWINEEGYPVRYEMDMSHIMGTMLEKTMTQMGDQAGDMKIQCNKVLVTMECYDFNAVEDFELPAEVAAA